MTTMTADQIPTFIDSLVALGCDVQAISPTHYVIGDADLPDKVLARIGAHLETVCKQFRYRDHLRGEIAAYLHSIGRVYRFNPRVMEACAD